MTTSDNTIYCIIADDEPLPIQLLEDYVRKTPGLRLVASTRNPMELLDLMHRQPVQLLFLDIQMPELTGFQVMKLLDRKCEVVITTAYPEYALEGYEHDVADFLLKPFSFDRFLVAINKCRKRLAAPTAQTDNTDAHFLVKSGMRLSKLFYKDVLYLEAMRDYVKVHLTEEVILTQQSLTSFEQQLPEQFRRIHRSFIVNTKKVSYVEGNRIGIGSIALPIGEKYQEQAKNILE
jgi:DNA-binding LytR/AlgR family response regulator